MAQDNKYHSPYQGFEKGDSLYTFNLKNPVFKSAKSNEKPFLVLPANSLVQVARSIETDYEIPYDAESYLPVSIGGKHGFIQRKHLAAEKIIIPNSNRALLFQLMTDSNSNYALKYREFFDDQIVNEAQLDLMTYAFSVYMMLPEGLDSLGGILVVDHIAEACGYDGGDTYYYYDPESLEKMAHLSSVGDGGVYYRVERLVFPKDKGGLDRKVIFEAEEFNMLDEETEWEEITTERRVYKWLSGRLYPEFQTAIEESE